MTTHQIFVENIKCEGCMNSIKNALLKENGVSAVQVLLEEDKVCVSGIAIDKDMLVKKLSSLGYPEKGSNNLISKAKSFVSCAIGNF